MSAAEAGSWKDLYQAALLETNPVKFNELVLKAQSAIEERLLLLQERSADREEFHALQDAMASLRALSRNSE
jgi:hypothetical protein